MRIADIYDSDRSARVTQQQQIDWYFSFSLPNWVAQLEEITNLESLLFYSSDYFFLPSSSSKRQIKMDDFVKKKKIRSSE